MLPVDLFVPLFTRVMCCLPRLFVCLFVCLFLVHPTDLMGHGFGVAHCRLGWGVAPVVTVVEVCLAYITSCENPPWGNAFTHLECGAQPILKCWML